MKRITDGDLRRIAMSINHAFGGPDTRGQHNEATNRYETNPGHIEVDHSGSAFYSLVEITSVEGSHTKLLGPLSKRELFNEAHAYLRGIEETRRRQRESNPDGFVVAQHFVAVSGQYWGRGTTQAEAVRNMRREWGKRTKMGTATIIASSHPLEVREGLYCEVRATSPNATTVKFDIQA